MQSLTRSNKCNTNPNQMVLKWDIRGWLIIFGNELSYVPSIRFLITSIVTHNYLVVSAPKIQINLLDHRWKISIPISLTFDSRLRSQTEGAKKGDSRLDAKAGGRHVDGALHFREVPRIPWREGWKAQRMEDLPHKTGGIFYWKAWWKMWKKAMWVDTPILANERSMIHDDCDGGDGGDMWWWWWWWS